MPGTQNQPLEYENVSYNAPDGVQICRTSTGKIGAFGTAPVVKQPTATAVTATGTVSTAGIFGFTTSTQANDIITQLNAATAALRAYGFL